MPITSELSHVADKLNALASSAASADAMMDGVVEVLHASMPRYNWVGFYMIERAAGEEPILVLGKFRGSMTPHTRIKLNQGICGAAASSGKTVIVDDVHSDPRYLACSIETKSEIVVPVFVAGEVVGELDIDSHFPAAFGDADKALCEHAATLAGDFLTKLRN
jgi:GAF domain-containing protein